MTNITQPLASSKPHYEILDGLRGVAAILVVFFHILEIHSEGDHKEQMINHGYLAVDFFFLLSGFVISYAYDNRWSKMTLTDFFKRRIFRLHPMIIFGSVIGAMAFYFQDSPSLGWAGIHDVPVWKTIMVMVIGCTLIPVGKGLDIRGWNEMHPLNGPAWSLFFEYIANIVYALFLRRVSNRVLMILMTIAGLFTLQYALTNPQGDIIGGWSIDDATQMKIGFLRLSFPFLAGLLLARIGKFRFIPYSFPIAAVLLVVLLAIPRLGGIEQQWLNGLYECICIMILFPFIIWLGASGKIVGESSTKICKFLGDISYPIYITHYPLAYTYYAVVKNNNYTLEQSWPMAILTIISSLLLAYGAMKFFDQPVRNWLQKKL